MSLLLFYELKAVFHCPQEPVGIAQGSCLVGADIAARAQLTQGVEGGSAADRRIVSTMHELEELNRKLHIADAAGSSLKLPL